MEEEGERIRERSEEMMKRMEKMNEDIEREEKMLRENEDIMERIDEEEKEMED